MEHSISEHIAFLYGLYGVPKEEIPIKNSPRSSPRKIWDYVKRLTSSHERMIHHAKTLSRTVSIKFPLQEFDVRAEEIQKLKELGELFFWRTRVILTNYKTKSGVQRLLWKCTENFVESYNQHLELMEKKFLLEYGTIFYETLKLVDVPHLLALIQEAYEFKLFDKLDARFIKTFISLNTATSLLKRLQKKTRVCSG